MANSVDPDQTAPSVDPDHTTLSVDLDQTAPSKLFAYSILSETLVYEILGHLSYQRCGSIGRVSTSRQGGCGLVPYPNHTQLYIAKTLKMAVTALLL